MELTYLQKKCKLFAENVRSYETEKIMVGNLSHTNQKIIPKFGDCCKLVGVVFEFDTNIEDHDFYDMMEKCKCKIGSNISKSEIIEYNLQFLSDIGRITTSGNSFCIEFPKWTTHEILLISLQFYELLFTLECNNMDIPECKIFLLVNYIYLNDIERHKFAENPQSRIYQNIVLVGSCNTTDNTITLNLDVEHWLVKGYFIKGHLFSMCEFLIKINNKNRFNPYDKIMINTLCHTINDINDDLLYFSYTGEKNFKSNTIESYDGSTNHKKTQKIEVVLKFDAYAQRDIKIYAVELKFLNYANGKLSVSDFPLY